MPQHIPKSIVPFFHHCLRGASPTLRSPVVCRAVSVRRPNEQKLLFVQLAFFWRHRTSERQICYFLNFFLKMAMPAKPPPTSNIVAGSGTGCGAGTCSEFSFVSGLYSDQAVWLFLAGFLIALAWPLFPDREPEARAFPSGVISRAKGANNMVRHTARQKMIFSFE